MADNSAKVAENVPGKYYVDTSCTACKVCVDTAPDNFKMTDDDDHAYVSKQPENADEEGLVKESMDGCPSEAIGADGE